MVVLFTEMFVEVFLNVEKIRFLRIRSFNISQRNLESMTAQPRVERNEERGPRGEREVLVEGLKMPLSASASSRGLLLCLYGRAHFNGRFTCLLKSVQKYISNGYCIRDERHF